MRNIYPDLMIKMLSGNKKSCVLFQIPPVCIGVCAYMYTILLQERIELYPLLIPGRRNS